MSVRHAVQSLAVAVFATVVLLPRPAAADAWVLAPGEYFSEFRGSFFSSDTYFDQDGGRPAPDASILVHVWGASLRLPRSRAHRVEERELRSITELGWKKGMSFLFQVPLTSVTVLPSTNSRLPGRLNNGFLPTQTGLSDALIGFKYQLKDGSTAAALEADWKAPLAYDRELFPALGDGQQDIGGVLHLGAALDRLNTFLEVSGGYLYRFETPPDEVRGLVDLGSWLGPSVLVSGHYEYFTTVGADTPLEESSAHIVGPQVIYRVDDHLDVVVGSRHTWIGDNVRHIDRYHVGFAYKLTKLNRLQGFLGNKRRS